MYNIVILRGVCVVLTLIFVGYQTYIYQIGGWRISIFRKVFSILVAFIDVMLFLVVVRGV